MVQLFTRLPVGVSLAALLVGCGDGDRPALEKGTAARPSGRGACALLRQSEVDEMFSTSVGAGESESLEDGAELCTWPAGQDPALLLQVGPAVSSTSTAVDLGEGYRIEEIPGMSGPGAMAVELRPAEGREAAVALLAMTVGEKTVTLSPIGLGVRVGSDRFERFKEIVELVAGRM